MKGGRRGNAGLLVVEAKNASAGGGAGEPTKKLKDQENPTRGFPNPKLLSPFALRLSACTRPAVSFYGWASLSGAPESQSPPSLLFSIRER